MITWVMVGLLLAAETTCGRNVVSENGDGKDETKQKNGLKTTAADEEDIYREFINSFNSILSSQASTNFEIKILIN